MSAEKLRAQCELSDCVYYSPDDKGEAGMCLCSHPDKAVHKHQHPCPLYRMDWRRQRGKVNLDDW